MNIYGDAKQEGEPSPSEPIEIKNKEFIYVKINGKKIKMPFNYEKFGLKEGDILTEYGILHRGKE